MSYESPIEVFIKKQREEYEDGILWSIYNQGVIIDKDELIKALQYDRGQYEIGYKEGHAEAYEDIILQLEAELESSNKYIREYDDNVVEKAYNKGLAAALRVVKEMVGETNETE